jgi:molybdate transport system substrate-binding protein
MTGPRSGSRPCRTHSSRWCLAAILAVLALGSAACGEGTVGEGTGDGSAIDGSITVFAAASLEGTFTELALRFEEAHPGAEITLNVAGSSDLATQIAEGAPADVFASADTSTMDRLVGAGLLSGDPTDFATNTLQLAVPPDNPADVASLADAARPGVKTVVCAAQVPCGAMAARVEEAAGIDLTPVSEEASVTDVLGKVRSGEADAGLVYVTDVRTAGGSVLGILVPEATGVITTYPIAGLAGSAEGTTTRAFLDFVTGTNGRIVLEEAGFGVP